jgi:hypothetical protein
MEVITKEFILDFIAKNSIDLSCTQPNMCIPIIDRIYRKMVNGIRFFDIKVDGSVICDGHHRYIASIIAKYSLSHAPSVKTSATSVISWKSVSFAEEDWDTPARILMWNKQDAAYNNIPLENVVEMLK